MPVQAAAAPTPLTSASEPASTAPGVPRLQFRPAAAHDAVRTFHPRRSPLGPARLAALEELWPTHGFSVHDAAAGPPPLTSAGALDLPRLFGRTAPVVLEIGSGMGETVAAMAAADPGRDYLAVEAHLPGIANLLRIVEAGGPTNVRVAHGDALELLRLYVPQATLDAVHVFFPDPWPKAKHHKRRIIAPDHVALIRSRLLPGGTLHCATDWATYADVMLATLEADPGLRNVHEGFAPRPAHRPVTKFEQRGIDLGHEIADLIFTRTA
ncbi:tRNA (guanosine(46)-N7)-methyltransferase TrmB [Actinotalea subterranea]|uniref:tRNA (guanosine(46)-N7)-methyltransferase TrmB n=1 Tax=Actinotalea subterranea TaxID=2607497 RepID=UPI001FE99E19|nr:tRNA (guanosine(46)-N7)-methyltransferase TrmB [Actinotalea subterranea]